MASIRSIRSSSERTSSRYTLWKPGPSFLSTIRCSNKPRAARIQSVIWRCGAPVLHRSEISCPVGIKQRDRVQQADTSLLHQIIQINSNIIFIQPHASGIAQRNFSDESQILFSSRMSRAAVSPFCATLHSCSLLPGRHFASPCAWSKVDWRNSVSA